VNTEERVLAQHFYVPVFEVEDFMRNRGRRVDGKLAIRGIGNRGVDRRFVVRNIRNGEVGESGYADGRRLNDWSDGGCRNCGRHRGGDRFEWRGLRELMLEFVWEPEGRDNWSCSGVFLVRTSWFGSPGREDRWGREALPPTLPQIDYLLKVCLSPWPPIAGCGTRTRVCLALNEVPLP